MNLAFRFASIYNHMIHAANEIRKQYSAEARVLSNSFVFLILVLYFMCPVFTLHTCIFCERKKLNKFWQFDFPFLKVIFSLAFSF